MALTIGLAKIMGWKLRHPNGLNEMPWVMPTEYRRIPTFTDLIKHGLEFSKRINKDLKKKNKKK
jgi:hypothetical protein